MQIQGQSVVVTGGASGLGAATARAFAEAGGRIAVLDLDAAGARRVAAEIGGVGAACDVGDGPSLEAAMAEARSAHGPARIAVACAGIAPAAKLVARDGAASPLEAFTRVIEVNLIGTINLMRVAAAEMMTHEALADGERGVLIATASIAAFEGQIGQVGYAASKGGIAGLILPAARELAREGIRAVAIAPGTFETPMITGLPETVQQQLIAGTLHPKRLGQPQEYARLARHIVENAMINGTVLRLDGAVRLAPR